MALASRHLVGEQFAGDQAQGAPLWLRTTKYQGIACSSPNGIVNLTNRHILAHCDAVCGGRQQPHLNAIAEKLKRRSRDHFSGRHFEAWLIVQAVAWYLRYPLSYRDVEEMFCERGFEVDHSTINRWVLAYAPVFEAAVSVSQVHCGSVRIDETYVKIRSKWRYLYRAIDKHGNPVDFLLTAKRDLDAAKRFFRKMLRDEPLLSPETIGTDGANTFPSTVKTSVEDGLLRPDPVHYVTKHLRQGIESDHFRLKKNIPKIGGFQSLKTARRTIAGFEAMLWLRKGFGFTGDCTVNDQNDLIARLFGLQKVNKA